MVVCMKCNKMLECEVADNLTGRDNKARTKRIAWNKSAEVNGRNDADQQADRQNYFYYYY